MEQAKLAVLVVLSCFAAVLWSGVLGEAAPPCRCVKPTAEQVHNPCPTGECHLLMDYAKFPANVSSNDTIFKFLPGTHTLSGVSILSFHCVYNLTLSGQLDNGDQNDSVVQCSELSGFWFEDIVDLQIDGLSFRNCGFQHYQNYSQALLLQYITNLSLSNVYIADTLGYGLYIVNLEGNSRIQAITIDGSGNKTGCLGGNIGMMYNDTVSSDRHSLLISDSLIANGHIPYNICSRYEAYASGFSIVLATTSSIELTLRNVTLTGSMARNGGNIAISYEHLETMTNWTSSVTLDNCTISNGSALLGGGLYLKMVAKQNNETNSSQFVDVISIRNTVFENNTADVVGGGLYAQLFEDVRLSTGANIKISHSKFCFNSVQILSSGGGVALDILTFNLAGYMPHHLPQFNVSLVSCQFYGNVVKRLSSNDPVGSGVLYIEQNSLTYFQDVEIVNNNRTGIVLIRSNLVLQGTNVISGNVGNYGGGIVLCDNSILYLQNSVMVNISHNRALSFGGGIYTEYDCTQAIPPCFFQFDNTSNKIISLENNLAGKSGSALYGGSIDYCYFFGHYDPENSTAIFSEIFHFPHHLPHDTSYITSNPMQACFCTEKSNGHLVEDCSDRVRQTEVYPGSTFEVHLVVVGQRNGSVPGFVVASNVTKECTTQPINKNHCMNLTYALSPEIACNHAEKEKVSVNFSVQDMESKGAHYSGTIKTLTVTLKPCPPGFQLQNKNSSQCACVCNSALQELDGIQCNISNTTIYKQKFSNGWFGFACLGNSSDPEIVSYPYCPFHYCNKTVTHAINVSQPLTANDQCAFNRYGILCGGCSNNLSVVLGSSKCSNCSGHHSKLRVFGLIAVFGVAGILLVAFLGVTDITVAEGTLNAIIFYVNVIAVNRSVFFTTSTNSVNMTILLNILKVSISWMNLDFGMEVCFYDGMTAFEKVLLQFFFPLYLWCISGAVIILCRKSLIVSNYFGKHSVKILATVILLSYAKLLRAVIDALFYTSLFHDSGHYTKVWSIDGNISYLGNTHIILFVIAIIVGLLTLPYTLALLFIQCLRRRSNMNVLFWVNKLKPFFDAYTGPYKDKYHFWTGFLLIVRIVLFIAIAVNTHSGELWNITLIIGTTSILFVLTRPGLYKNCTLNIIEVLVYANLTLLAVSTAFNTKVNGSNNFNVTLCIGSVIVFFGGIVVYHILKKLSVTQTWGLVKVWLLDRRWPWMKRKQIRSLILPYVDPDNDEDPSGSDSELDPILQNAPPVARYDEYREPLIGNTGND